jgi:hypothetical protein
MSYQQLVAPNPNIPCQPGWCLQYVRQAFGAPVVEPTATAGWNNAKYRHTDWDFPEGCWVPLWFQLATEPAGHVVLRAPNGKIYSTTNPYQYTPRVHPNLADLFAAYAPYNPLTYLGWSEDISGVRVVQEFSITPQSNTTPLEDDMPSAAEVARAILDFQVDQVGVEGKMNLGSLLAEYRINNNKIVENTSAWIMPEVIALKELVRQLSVKQGVTIDYDAIEKAVNDGAAKRMAK